MAGHNKWSKIKRQKGAADAKRGAVFTKLGNKIAIAARKGTDPDMNPDLAAAIDEAKRANMPKANIERSIARIADKNAAELKEVLYEGYGPQGVAFIIEAATDNTNRTLPEVKTALTKNGGRLAEPGSVTFQFEQKGVLIVKNTEDNMLLALDNGAADAKEDDDELVIFCTPSDLNKLRTVFKDNQIEIEQSGVEWVSQNQISLDEETEAKVTKIMDALDDIDDVTNIHTNAEI